MSAENVQLVERIQESLPSDDVVAGIEDREAGQRLARALAELADPDFEVVMVGPDYLPRAAEGRGIAGLREAWKDWASPFERLRIETEDYIDAGDRVVTLVTQTGTTKTGGVEIEESAAAVWTIRDAKLVRVEFHLDREAALRAAGLRVRAPRSS